MDIEFWRWIKRFIGIGILIVAVFIIASAAFN